ncbi:MAG TPA: hypothetical protein VHT75_15820 [Acidimicrobiales bacterium]|jgi:hypothetical protein|nr:hypothetical protein [Acidimicrobiales bacterium]
MYWTDPQLSAADEARAKSKVMAKVARLRRHRRNGYTMAFTGAGVGVAMVLFASLNAGGSGHPVKVLVLSPSSTTFLPSSTNETATTQATAPETTAASPTTTTMERIVMPPTTMKPETIAPSPTTTTPQRTATPLASLPSSAPTTNPPTTSVPSQSTTTFPPAETATAARMLAGAVVPPDAVQVSAAPSSALNGPSNYPACSPMIDESKVYVVDGTLQSVSAFLQSHPSAGMAESGVGTFTGPDGVISMSVTQYPIDANGGGPNSLVFTEAPLPAGQIGLRVDALVIPSGSICQSSGTAH